MSEDRLEQLRELLALGVYVTLIHAGDPEFRGLAREVDKVWNWYEYALACAELEARGYL